MTRAYIFYVSTVPLGPRERSNAAAGALGPRVDPMAPHCCGLKVGTLACQSYTIVQIGGVASEMWTDVDGVGAKSAGREDHVGERAGQGDG